jgi:N,N'-diacetyl-8-epilegionaminate cytidylyltransferase
MKNEKVRAFVFARGGSKGIPGKNIKLLGGKPLIAHSIEKGLAAPSLGQVSVSTDDAEIARVARTYGAAIPFVRPAELATDSAGEWGAWRHAIRWHAERGDPFDIIVSLPSTSPFRSVEDIEACLACLLNDPKADIVVTVKKADRSPYFNVVEIGADGYARLVKSTGINAVQRRQDAPAVYDMTTVAYAARTAFVLAEENMFSGKVRTIIVPPERALDIDTPFDFLIAELLESHQAGTRPTVDPQ